MVTMDRQCKNVECKNTLKRTQKSFCSRSCRNKTITTKGQKKTEEHKQKIGAAIKGNKRPDLSHRNKTDNPTKRGSEHDRWQGDDVGYIALHQWLRRNHTFPESCEKCGSKNSLHISNKTNVYNRDRENWWILCASCHKKYDNQLREAGVVFDTPRRWSPKVTSK